MIIFKRSAISPISVSYVQRTDIFPIGFNWLMYNIMYNLMYLMYNLLFCVLISTLEILVVVVTDQLQPRPIPTWVNCNWYRSLLEIYRSLAIDDWCENFSTGFRSNLSQSVLDVQFPHDICIEVSLQNKWLYFKSSTVSDKINTAHRLQIFRVS